MFLGYYLLHNKLGVRGSCSESFSLLFVQHLKSIMIVFLGNIWIHEYVGHWTSCTDKSLMALETSLCLKWSDNHAWYTIEIEAVHCDCECFSEVVFECSENFPLGRPSSSSSWESKVLVNLCVYVWILIGLLSLTCNDGDNYVITNFTFTLIQIKDASIFNDSGGDDDEFCCKFRAFYKKPLTFSCSSAYFFGFPF